MVRDNCELSDDSRDVPKSNGLVDGSNPGLENVSLLDKN